MRLFNRLSRFLRQRHSADDRKAGSSISTEPIKARPRIVCVSGGVIPSVRHVQSITACKHGVPQSVLSSSINKKEISVRVQSTAKADKSMSSFETLASQLQAVKEKQTGCVGDLSHRMNQRVSVVNKVAQQSSSERIQHPPSVEKGVIAILDAVAPQSSSEDIQSFPSIKEGEIGISDAVTPQVSSEFIKPPLSMKDGEIGVSNAVTPHTSYIEKLVPCLQEVKQSMQGEANLPHIMDHRVLMVHELIKIKSLSNAKSASSMETDISIPKLIKEQGMDVSLRDSPPLYEIGVVVDRPISVQQVASEKSTSHTKRRGKGAHKSKLKNTQVKHSHLEKKESEASVLKKVKTSNQSEKMLRKAQSSLHQIETKMAGYEASSSPPALQIGMLERVLNLFIRQRRKPQRTIYKLRSQQSSSWSPHVILMLFAWPVLCL